MSLFTYTAFNENGKIIKGKENADNRIELIENLREKNIFCISSDIIEEKKQKARYKFKTKKLALLCRQLSAMLSSGINLVRAIHILMTQEENVKAKEVLRDIYEELQRGRSFSETLENKPGVFPNLFSSMVAAGEISGSLDTIIDRISDHYAKEAKLRNTIMKAMIYPVVLGVLMLAVVVVLFTFVMPMFVKMFPDPNDIPSLTKVMLGISDFLINKWFIVVGVVFGLALGVRAVLKIPEVRIKFDYLKCSMPKIGKLICTVYTARFARTMSNLFASGMQMVECIEKSVQTLGNVYIINRFDFVLEEVKKGESLSVSISKTGIFESIFTSSIYIGEESGKLDEILSKNADYYDEEADSAIGQLVSMLEPVLIVIMGAMVALVLASIFPALYSSFEGVAQ